MRLGWEPLKTLTKISIGGSSDVDSSDADRLCRKSGRIDVAYDAQYDERALSSYQSIATLRSDDGLVAEVTSKERQGFVSYTVALFKEFETERGAETRRTSYIPARLIHSAISLLTQASERIQVEQDRLVVQKRRHRA